MKYNTEKRKKIIELLSAYPGKSFSSEQICAVVIGEGSGKSTVYRILSDMLKEGKIKKISSQSSRKVSYQYVNCQKSSEHLHLKCKDCGLLIHLDEETSHKVEESLMAARCFAIDEGELLFGRCEGCQAERRAKND